MTPSWYDVLDVDPGADAEQIREAWRASIADLSPGERGFRLRNEAAEVLLDPERRREYDAELQAEAEAEAETAETDREPEEVPGTVAVPVNLDKEPTAPEPEPEATGEPLAETAETTKPTSRSGGPSTLVLALLSVLALAMVAMTVVVLIVQSRASSVEDAADQGLAAAEQAIVPVLSYDYRQMEQSKAAAENFLTPSFSKEYDKLFAQLTINAPETETVVTTEVVASGIVSAEADEVLAFVFINRPTQKQDTEPRVYRDQVTVRMQKVDDEWLVAELITATPPA